MIRINLLPHREHARAARTRQFNFMAVGVIVLGGFIIFLVHSYFASSIDAQAQRNKYLEGEIAKLDKEIVEIKGLQEQIQSLLARKQVVENLQSNRSMVVHLLDQLVRLLPDGVYFKGVKQTGNVVNLQGYAQSNARIATLIRNLDSSPFLEAPDLVESKAVMLNNLRVSEFSLNVKLTPPQTQEVTPAAGAKAPEAKKL